MMKRLIKLISKFMLSPIVRFEGPKGSVYLTFDDGPHEHNTTKVLECLQKHDAKATFFFNGDSMERLPHVVRAVRDAGHQIGYHSFRHEKIKALDPFGIDKDLALGKQLLLQYGIGEFLYRPPYGHLTPMSLLIAPLRGWKVVMWSVEGRDSFDSERQIIKNLDLDKVALGSIILLHDPYDQTVKVLPEILSRYASKGLSLDKLSFR